MNEPIMTPKNPETPASPAESNAANAETPSGQKPAEASVHCTVTSVADGKETTAETDCRFHTPSMLAAVEKLADTDRVKFTTVDPGKTEPRVLLEGTKQEAITALSQSIVPAAALPAELRKFAQFLLDHSTLKAIGVHAICTDSDGKDAGFGFAATASDCTIGQAVALVNCGDANLDEFVTKAKLDIPGRNGAPAKGTIVTPTPEQVEKLG